MRYKGLVVPGLLWASIAYNMAVVSFTTGNILEELNLSKLYVGSLVSITLIGWFFGSAIFGYLSDKMGRKRIVLLGTPLHVVATAAMFFASSYPMYMVLRFIAGLGFGIVLPILSTLVSESSDEEIRGRMVVLLDSFWTYGWVLASLAALILLPRLNNWKVYYLVAILWLLLLPLATRLPETKKPSKREKVPIGTIVKNPRTYALWAIWFAMAMSYYGMFIWLPKIFSEHYPVLRSSWLLFISMLFQVAGFLLAAYLIEKVGRRKVLFTFMLLTAVSAYIFITGATLFGAILLSFFDLGAWGALYAYTPELYSKEVRGSGAGFANSVGRIGGILGPLIPGFFTGWFQPFMIFTAALLLTSFLTFALPETMKRDKNQ